jgi:hypothetical protein
LYIDEIEAERKNITIVLFGISRDEGKKNLFPLYAPKLETAEAKLDIGLERLRAIMRKFRSPIEEKPQAQKFLDEIKKLNDELKKPNGKLGSSSETSTSDITEGNYEFDYNEAEEEPDVTQGVFNQIMKLNTKTRQPPQHDEPAGNVPLLPAPPRV